jgi:hypothetical protein
MDAAPVSCATCGWHGVPAGAYCPSCGAQLTNLLAQPMAQSRVGATASSDNTRIGWRIALAASAGALLIIFLTLFVVGLALGSRNASADPLPTLAPEFPSATALLTVAPQTPSPKATDTPKSGGGGKGGEPTATPLPTAPIPPAPTNTPIPPAPTPTISSGGG